MRQRDLKKVTEDLIGLLIITPAAVHFALLILC